jgi:holo-[acyl-carrier protein] synthase
MPIVAIGLDLARIDRLEAVYARHRDRFLERIFTAGERSYCDKRASRMASYTGRFAVKEAVMKALGTGWSSGVTWREIEVVRESGSAPKLVLHGMTARVAETKGIHRFHITITHDGGIAAAVAIAEA